MNRRIKIRHHALLLAAAVVALLAQSARAAFPEVKLVATNAAQNDRLGYSVAVSGDYVLGSAPFTSSSAGSAYLFDLTTESQLFEFRASDRSSGDEFGEAVAMTGAAMPALAPPMR